MNTKLGRIWRKRQWPHWSRITKFTLKQRKESSSQKARYPSQYSNQTTNRCKTMRYGCIQVARYTSILKRKYPITKETFTDTFDWNDANDKMWSCNMCAGMRIFSCVSYVTETKYIGGINWLCPGVAYLSNQTICSEWTDINFANRSPRLRAVASCAAYLNSSEVGLFTTK